MKMHLTMKGRLTALALLAVIGICLLAALAVGSNQVTRNALASLYEQDMDSLVRLQRMDNTLVELRFRVAGVLLDQMPIPGSLNHLRDSRTSLAQEWAALAPRGDGLFVEGPAKEAFGQLRDKWSLVDATLAKLERAYGAKDKNAIGSILEDDWPVLVKAVAKPLQGLIPITQGIAQAAYDDALARSRTLLCAGVIGAAACLAGLLALAGFTARSMLRPLREVEAAMQRIAEGDLAAPMPAARRDEVGRTIAALTDMRQRLRDLVVEVRRSTESITTASTEIASGSQDLSGRTERTASNLQQTASSMEQLTGTVRQSADAARQANTLADGAAAVAGRGGEVVGRVVATMDEINAASRRIADIIAVIDGIAFQTNILALNAAVEAARAGEQGRGFAVVAGEVRTLAQRSADAAREIKALIGSSVERVDAGSRLVADAGSTMQEIVTSVRRVSGIVAEISAATAEQSNGIGEVNGAVTQLDEMTQQNAALVEQTAAAASSLQDQAQRLSQIVATFRVEAQAA